MSIANDKIVNLQDAKVLYEDLRGRIKDNVVAKVLDTPADIQSFSDAARFPMELKVGIDPVQDLHGYDHPWVGGAGKNLLPKGSTSTVSGITFTVNDDGTVLVTGTSTSSASVFWGTAVTLPAGNYILNGCPSGGGTDSYRIDIRNNIAGNMISPNADTGNGANVTISEAVSGYVCIRVGANYAFPSAGLLFKPMIRLSTETDATFAPYENVCPITGWTGANVTVTGKNILNKDDVSAYYVDKNGKIEAHANFVLTGFIKVDDTFTISGYDAHNYVASMCFYDENKRYISGIEFYKTSPCVCELPPNAKYIRVSLRKEFADQMQIEYGTAATTYEAFGQVYHITFPTSAGTVYGGSLTVHADGTGTLVVDRVGKELPLTGWETSLSWNTMLHQTIALDGLVDAQRDDLVLCSHAKSVTNNHMYYSRSDTNLEPKISKGTEGQIRIRMLSVATTPEEYLAYFTAQKEAGTPITIAYLLATPVTYYLTPGQVFSLLNQSNNVWADCGQINYLEYVRDTVGEVVPNRFDGIEKELAKINNKVGVVYGFHIDSNESDPDAAVTYVGDAVGMIPAKMDFTNERFSYGSWEDAFFMPRPCMLKYDGTVDYYLDPNDYSKKANGTASDVANTAYGGNAMMEWGRDGKKIWYAIVPDTGDYTSATIYVADHQADERFHAWPFINTEGKMADHFYTPCYFGTVIDGKIRSLSGQSGANRSKGYTATQERALVKANNPSGVDIWDMESWSETIMIQLILVLIGKSLNGQDVFGFGLANGGSDANNDGFVSGQHDNKGLFYGTNNGAISVNGNAVKVLGMENWWGFSWRRILGLVLANDVYKTKLCYGEADGSTTNDYIMSSDATDYAGYVEQSAVATGTSGSLISQMHFNRGMLLPHTVSGTASTYFCDTTTFKTGTQFAGRGGASTSASGCGPFAIALNNPSSLAYWSFGASPSCRPLT